LQKGGLGRATTLPPYIRYEYTLSQKKKRGDGSGGDGSGGDGSGGAGSGGDGSGGDGSGGDGSGGDGSGGDGSEPRAATARVRERPL
jgi:hypothetical protein